MLPDIFILVNKDFHMSTRPITYIKITTACLSRSVTVYFSLKLKKLSKIKNEPLCANFSMHKFGDNL